MNISKDGNASIITYQKQENKPFVEELSMQHNSFKTENVIVDLSSAENVALDDILAFIPLSKKHRKGKKSFVIVVQSVDYNEVPEEIVVVPTILEAHDMIEMEEIERDLGF